MGDFFCVWSYVLLLVLSWFSLGFSREAACGRDACSMHKVGG